MSNLAAFHEMEKIVQFSFFDRIKNRSYSLLPPNHPITINYLASDLVII